MINPLKKKLFETKGTTESKELDKILETILEIKENKDNICISEISILELICTLNRQKSGNKIFKILSLLYDTCNILPFNYNRVHLHIQGIACKRNYITSTNCQLIAAIDHLKLRQS